MSEGYEPFLGIAIAPMSIEIKAPTQNGDLELEVIQCPYCKGVFAVDVTYIDQVDELIHCPMCCMEVIYPESASDTPLTVIYAEEK